MIDSFHKEHAFLSNFFYSPITINHKSWPTAEHVFQAAKTLDKDKQDEIRLALTPKHAKKLGRSVTLRSDWEKVKKNVMYKIVRLKFLQNAKIRQQLLLTGSEKLVEGNIFHDNFWGNCKCIRCVDVKGENVLGKILMRVREELKPEHYRNEIGWSSTENKIL